MADTTLKVSPSPVKPVAMYLLRPKGLWPMYGRPSAE
jgi:hypothetical protein